MNDSTVASGIRAKAGKFLTFNLGVETYGIAIHFVREILGLTAITPVPNTPKFIKGVTNLRGKIIPLIDLRVKLNMDVAEFTRQTCIIVVDVPGVTERIQMGVIVDGVKEVLNVKKEDLEDVPSFGIRVDTSYLLGLANCKTGISLLLDIERVLTQSEIEAVETIDVNNSAEPVGASAEVPAENTAAGQEETGE
jgi:purine-binding chemotaxis protein CheW